jgi:chromosome partitioning protein
MNAKGGVGKSTTTMMIADTLASRDGKRILVIDADPQASISMMLLGEPRLDLVLEKSRTLPALLDRLNAGERPKPAEDGYIQRDVSDIRNSRGLDLLAGDFTLAWLERSEKASNDAERDGNIPDLLRAIGEAYDYVFIDCPPSVTRFTEAWLASSDFILMPTRPDYLSTRGLMILTRLRERFSDIWQRDFPETLGTVITMVRKQGGENERKWVQKIKTDPSNRAFRSSIPYHAQAMEAADFQDRRRTYKQKYEADLTAAAHDLTDEIVYRINSVAR